MRRYHTFLFLMLVLLVGACSKSDPQSAVNTLRQAKPCELLTAEDIQEVTGHAMESGEEKHDISCNFASVEKQGQFDLPKYNWYVQHLHHDIPLEEEVRQYRAGMTNGLGEDAKDYVATPVSGVGDRAFWETFLNVAQLVVFKADGAGATDVISVQPDFVGEESAQEDAKALAERVLKRL